MSSRIEENARIKSDCLKNLETISYDEIVDKLMDSHNSYQIEFYDEVDILENKTYKCLSMFKNGNTSTLERFLVPDQEDKKIYNGIIAALLIKGKNTLYQTRINERWQKMLTCQVGNSVLLFPNVFKALKEWSESIPLTGENSIWCVDGNKEIRLSVNIPDSKSRKRTIDET